MNQSRIIRSEINRLLDMAITQTDIILDKQAIYDMVQDKTKAPRPTIRRVARDIKKELQSKANILSEQSHGHGRPLLDRMAHK